MATVKDVMTYNVVALREAAEFKEIIKLMRRRRFSACPVLDYGDRVVGVVSEADLLVKEASLASAEAIKSSLRRKDRAKAGAVTAAELMTSPAATISPDQPLADAARIMCRKRVKRLPVVSDTGRLLGIISRADVLSVFDRPDTEIGDAILAIIAADFGLDPAGFTVTVKSGVVTLSGTVVDGAAALALLDMVRHADGVVAVQDRLSYPEVQR